MLWWTKKIAVQKVHMGYGIGSMLCGQFNWVLRMMTNDQCVEQTDKQDGMCKIAQRCHYSDITRCIRR